MCPYLEIIVEGHQLRQFVLLQADKVVQVWAGLPGTVKAVDHKFLVLLGHKEQVEDLQLKEITLERFEENSTFLLLSKLSKIQGCNFEVNKLKLNRLAWVLHTNFYLLLALSQNNYVHTSLPCSINSVLY